MTDTSQSGPAAPAVPAIPTRVWRVAYVVVVGAFMTQLDSALVNVGLATIARDLSASLQTTQWLVSAYLLALTIGLPLCGWASKRLGAATVWLWALTGFTLASLLCAVAPGIGWLIAFRFLQGFTGGLLLPAGQTVIAQVAGRGLMGRVMSTVGMALVLGPALGPVIGGLLIAHASWPWLFLVNLPVGVVGLWLGRRYLPREAQPVRSPFDAVGFVLVGVALPLITFAVSRVGENPGLRDFWAPLIVGVLALAAFARRSLTAPAPLLNLRLFRSVTFGAGAGASFLAGAIQFGALVIWALYFQLSRGYDVVHTGLAMVGFALGAATLPLAGRLTDRFGGGVVAVAGGVLTTVVLVPMALLPPSADLPVLELWLFLLGVGNALSVVPASTAVYVHVEPASMPDAVTVINIFLRLGGAVGSALLVAVLGSGSSSSAVITHFHAAFWCLAVLGVLSVATATVLTRASTPVRAA